MELQANPLTVILVLGALHGVALGIFVFFNKRGDRGANVVLGILLVAFSINFGLPKIVKDYHIEFPHLIAAAYPLPLLLGPLLYLYAKRFTCNSESRTLKKGLHFLPFLAVTLYLMPFYLQSGADKLAFIRQIRSSGLPVDWLALSGIKTLHLLCYLGSTFWMLKQHSRQIKAVFSSIEKIHLGWLRYLVLGMGCVWFVQFVFYLGFVFEKLTDPYIVADYASGYATAIFVYSIGYMGLRQPEIFAPATRELSKKYQRSGLTPDKAERYLEKLLTHMEQNKPYRDSELTLPQLASEINIPPNHLSQIINEKLQQNFFDLINEYRVDEVKHRLANRGNNHFTILAMAFDAGFNSKSAFYNAFLKHTGTSPSRYVQSVQQ